MTDKQDVLAEALRELIGDYQLRVDGTDCASCKARYEAAICTLDDAATHFEAIAEYESARAQPASVADGNATRRDAIAMQATDKDLHPYMYYSDMDCEMQIRSREEARYMFADAMLAASQPETAQEGE
jgi:hypothetical protein